MKKKKLGLIFNICTICLAISAIAIGVYSLKQANVNINGSLGFTAHGVKANIVTSITGSVANVEDTYSKTDVYQPNGSAGVTVDNDTKEITFTRYFSDNGTVNDGPAPIKMTFAITNQSSYAIKVDVVTPTLPTGVQMTADKSSIKIEKNGTGSITATFTLDSTVTDFSATKLTGFGLELSKFDYSKTDITVNYDSEGKLSNYYIEYGTGKVGTTTYGINWYIIGTYGSDGQIQKLTPASDLTTVTENSTYKMKDTITYAFMSEYILTSGGGTTSQTKYVVFNDNAYFNENDGKYYSNEYSEVQVNDYSISTVRAYLAGAKISTSSNFFIQNSLNDSNVYTLIQTRTLTSLYTKMSYGETSADIAIPTDKTEGIYGDDADAFWLLSYNESRTLWSSVDNCVGKILIPESSNTSSYTVSDGAWLLRTPNTNGEIEICDCDSFGAYYNSGYVFALSGGVRPAFLI